MPKLLMVGSDPEYFIHGPGGRPVAPQQAKIPGTKRNPFRTNWGAIHRDGACLELNIIPASSPDELIANMFAARTQALEAYLLPYNYYLSELSVLHIPERWIRHKEIMIMGCDPSFDCWGLDSSGDIDPFNLVRCAGGHVHISYEDPDLETSTLIARILDVKLGLKYSTLRERDNPRRLTYGRSGQMRITNYGLEYRTLSNKWTFSEEDVRDVFSISKDVVENVYDYWNILSSNIDIKDFKYLFYNGTDAEVVNFLGLFGE